MFLCKSDAFLLVLFSVLRLRKCTRRQAFVIDHNLIVEAIKGLDVMTQSMKLVKENCFPLFCTKETNQHAVFFFFFLETGDTVLFLKMQICILGDK